MTMLIVTPSLFTFFDISSSHLQTTKVAYFISASDFVGGRSEIGNKMDANGKGKTTLYRSWTSLQGYRRLRLPEYIAIRHIRVQFNINVYVLLVTCLYIRSTVVVQTSQPLCIH
jgi:hypothetical protein